MSTKPTRAPTAHIVPFGLRLQPELKARLEESAKANGRSLNAEIAARLEASLEESQDTRAAMIPIMEKLDALTEMLRSERIARGGALPPPSARTKK